MRANHFFLVTSASVLLAANAFGNLFVNGDFQSGNTGFTSQYATYPGAIGVTETTYEVLKDPYDSHSGATSYFDHTAGTDAGLMLAVNGSGDGSLAVWAQDVAVTAGQQYELSFWLSTWFPESPASMDVRIGGVSQGLFAAPGIDQTGKWVRHSFLWTATTTGPVNFAFFDQNLDTGGNDFALDDISLTAVPEPSTFLAGALLALALVRARRR